MSTLTPPVPRVSVITVFLDPGPYLVEAIESVLSQTFGDLELVLVDDGSTDGSSEVARGYEATYPGRVRYVEHPGHANQGIGASRNRGLAAACGELVAFLDADDAWYEDSLARQVAVLDQHPDAGVVVGATLYWWSWNPAELDRADAVYTPAPAGRLAGAGVAVGLVTGAIDAPSMNAVVARRSACDAVGGFEAAFRGLYEDQVWLFKLYLAFPVVFHGQVIDRYRQHPNSIYARGLASGYDRVGAPSEARSRFIDFALAYLDQKNHGHRAAGWAIRRATLRDRRAALRSLPGPGSRWHPGGLPRRLRDRVVRRMPSPLPRALALQPVSPEYGFDRGLPVDRRYIERFLDDHRSDVRGAVLEIGDATYTRRFGGEAVTSVDVLHITDQPEATIVGDLADAPHIPDAAFDCVIFTQTLHLIFDLQAVVATLHRILRPGGVLLLTVPGLTALTEQEGWGHYWTFTDRSVARLFGARFEEVVVHVFGNVAAATAFLYGYAEHEVPRKVIDVVDRRYPVTVAARIRRAQVSHTAGEPR